MNVILLSKIFIKHQIYTQISMQIYQQVRLNKINEIKNYLLAEVRERELIGKNLSKYIASSEYFSNH